MILICKINILLKIPQTSDIFVVINRELFVLK